jgi:RNA polymerase sigma-70 factor (ECF subfamily)
LPSEQSEVVILKHWEDLTFAEIAEVLGISQNTVASRYRYAMEKLQRALEGVVR